MAVHIDAGTALRALDARGQSFERLVHCLDPALPVLHLCADALGGFGAVEYLGNDRRVTFRLELEAPVPCTAKLAVPT